MQVSLQQHLAQRAVPDILQGRHDAGVVQAELPALVAVLPGAVFGRLSVIVRQTVDFGFVVHDHLIGFGRGQHMIAERMFQFGYAAVDFLEPVAVGLVQFGAATHETLIGLIQQPLFHLRQIQLVGLVL